MKIEVNTTRPFCPPESFAMGCQVIVTRQPKFPELCPNILLCRMGPEKILNWFFIHSEKIDKVLGVPPNSELLTSLNFTFGWD